ncbi:MAG: NAD(P)H:quinone oxidoreductase, partial [Acidithiobacillus ferrivorans]
MKIQIIFHSMSGHVYKLAESIAAGAREVYETGVALYQVPELIPQETLVATGAQASRSAFSHIPVATPEQMVE